MKARGLYVRAYRGSPADLAEVRGHVDHLRRQYYLDGPPANEPVGVHVEAVVGVTGLASRWSYAASLQLVSSWWLESSTASSQLLEAFEQSGLDGVGDVGAGLADLGGHEVAEAEDSAVLEISEASVLFLSGLLHAERVRRGTRKGTRALGTYKQAVLVLRWFLDDTRMSVLVRDNNIAVSTAYDYRDEGIAVLSARRPSLHGALLAAKAAGHSHVIVDGTLIYTDRVSAPGPAPRAPTPTCWPGSPTAPAMAPSRWPI